MKSDGQGYKLLSREHLGEILLRPCSIIFQHLCGLEVELCTKVIVRLLLAITGSTYAYDDVFLAEKFMF